MSDCSQTGTAEPPRTNQAATTRALLQVWLSPSFPVGAFAYSHGLEKAVENRWINNRETLQAWLSDLITLGSLHNDLILLAASWRATKATPTHFLAGLADLAAALQPSAERHLEATQQGASFIAQIETTWPAGTRTWADAAQSRTPTYAIAVGFAAAVHDIPLAGTLEAYAIAFIGNLTSAAIRLSVIGQTDAQRITASLIQQLLTAAANAERSTLDNLGGATWRADLASLQHETQHTRLFRS
jgi:urease accessory protein